MESTVISVKLIVCYIPLYLHAFLPTQPIGKFDQHLAFKLVLHSVLDALSRPFKLGNLQKLLDLLNSVQVANAYLSYLFTELKFQALKVPRHAFLLKSV